MQDNHLFEYAVIRIVPHVEREEFINAGVILYCSDMKFLKTRMAVNHVRLHALCDKMDMEELEKHMNSFNLICKGGSEAGPIGKLSQAERFRWLTASRSTILQTSPVHPGLLQDPQQTLDRLFEQLVA